MTSKGALFMFWPLDSCSPTMLEYIISSNNPSRVLPLWRPFLPYTPCYRTHKCRCCVYDLSLREWSPHVNDLSTSFWYQIIRNFYKNPSMFVNCVPLFVSPTAWPLYYLLKFSPYFTPQFKYNIQNISLCTQESCPQFSYNLVEVDSCIHTYLIFASYPCSHI